MSLRRAITLVSVVLATAACSTTPNDKPDTDYSEAALINMQLGLNYLNQGRYDLALRKLNKALDQDPRRSEVQNALGIAYERLAEFKLADEHYRKAVDLGPKDSNALTNYGSFLCKRGKVSQALELFGRALANNLYETPEIALTNAGLCMASKKGPTDAEHYYLKALRLNPGYPSALVQMGKLRLHAGQHLSARAYLQRYLEVASHTPETLWLGIRIERQLGDRDALASYSLLLKNKFPDSEETRLFLESEMQ